MTATSCIYYLVSWLCGFIAFKKYKDKFLKNPMISGLDKTKMVKLIE